MRCAWCNKYFKKTKLRKKYCSLLCRNSKKGKYSKSKKKYIRTLIWSKSQGRTVNLRSSYELTYIKWLDENKIIWLYEPRKFVLEEGVIYIPDFYLPELNEWHEVKGKWMGKSKQKFEDVQRLYPKENFKVVGTKEIMEIRKQMGEQNGSSTSTSKISNLGMGR